MLEGGGHKQERSKRKKSKSKGNTRRESNRGTAQETRTQRRSPYENNKIRGGG